MHIPDNYLSPATCAVMGAAMVPVWVSAVQKVKQEVPRDRLPLLGVGAAFSFLLMMFNVPVPGGTTAHAVGGTLLAVVLGPWSATIAISVALLLQAVIFGDGGILSFGANCFNMAFVIPFVGYGLYRLVKTKNQTGELVGLAVASYIAINAAALCAAIELGIQPLLFKNAAGLPLYCPYPLAVSIPAMLIAHLTLAGAAEVFFTVGIVSFIRRVSPGMIYTGGKMRIRTIYTVIIALAALSPLGLLAAGTAWGEWGANDISKVVTAGRTLGFVPQGMVKGFTFAAPLGDYSVKGLPPVVGYIISAIAGVAVLIILFKLLGLALSKRSDSAGNGVRPA
jgi:cobalt/nickel transport system permease protein